MSTLYVGVFIGFIMGTFAGVILAAVLVAARDESKRLLSDSEIEAWEDL